jgi:hypothetical protein
MQAETEDEMKDWISAFEKAKLLAIQSEQVPSQSQIVSSPTATDETYQHHHNNDHRFESPHEHSKYSISHVDASKSFISSPETTTSGGKDHEPHQPSIVLLSTSADNDRVSLANSTSLTPLLVWEAARAPSSSLHPATSPFIPATNTHVLQHQQTTKESSTLKNGDAQSNTDADTDTKKTISDKTIGGSRLLPKRPMTLSLATEKPKPVGNTTTNSSWGIPWTLVPSMFQSSGDSNEPPPTPAIAPPSPQFGDLDGHQVIWPANIDDSGLPKVELADYTAELEQRNRDLRSLFGGVAAHEVVLDGKQILIGFSRTLFSLTDLAFSYSC